MKTNNSFIKAFTVMEMLINMIIMSIIIGMVYYAYSSFAKQVSYYQISMEEEINIDRFLLQLKTDFFNAEKIIQKSNSNSFDVIFYNTNKISYSLKENHFLRTQKNNTDSLKINQLNLDVITNTTNQEKLVQKVFILCSLFNEPIEFVAVKNYPVIIKYGD